MLNVLEYLGPAPYEEACAQVGQDGFSRRNRAELRIYKAQVLRVCGDLPKGLKISVEWSGGSTRYGELVFAVDETVADGLTEADHAAIQDYIQRGMRIDSWDEQSRQELQIAMTREAD